MKMLNVTFCVTVLAFLLGLSHCQKLKVIQLSDPDDEVVLTSGSDYAKQQLDVVWNITYSAEIEIDKFDIDFQAGEYVIVCEYPLPSDYRLSDGAPAEEALSLLPLENSLLLTSYVVPEPSTEDDDENNNLREKKLTQTVRIKSVYGGFIYFHGIEKKNPKSLGKLVNWSDSDSDADSESELSFIVGTASESNGTFMEDVEIEPESMPMEAKALEPSAAPVYDGFRMTLQYLELYPEPVTTTTTERLTTPAPGVDIYLYKHIIGQTPAQFYKGLTEFKEVVAEMANDYCEFKNIILKRPIVSNNVTDDIRLDKDSILFCDRHIIHYDTCVQIRMAIPVRDTMGYYAMNTTNLEEMWDKYAEDALTRISVGEGEGTPRPYEPPTGVPTISTWIWVAAILGVILLLCALLLTTLVTTVFDRRSTRAESAVTMALNDEDDGETPRSSISRKNNPLSNVLHAMKQKTQDAQYRGMGAIEQDIAMRNKNSLSRIPKPDYDNPGFIHELDEYSRDNGMGRDRFQYQLPVPQQFNRQQNDRGSLNRNPNQNEHTFQVEVHSNSNDGNSDSDGELDLYTPQYRR